MILDEALEKKDEALEKKDEALEKKEIVEDLDKVTGGMVIQDSEGRYWAYSDDGEKFFPAYTKDVGLAQDIARDLGWSDKVITNPLAPAKEDS